MTSHLRKYLDYYNKLNAPEYAVLVTGPWGIGKTYQVRHFLSESQHYYVSLFGMKSTEEVHGAVIAAVAPNVEKVRRGVRELGRAAEKLGGWFSLGASASTLANALLRKQLVPDRTLVFDDMERSGLPSIEIMGVLNTYLYQHKFRVVAIAHDEKLVEDFKIIKEKVFGQTIKVEPQVEDAFDNFLSLVNGVHIADFVDGCRDLVLQAFRESGATSLRVLRHLIEDLARLRKALTSDHLANPEAVRELVGLFCALNIEVRTGNLNAEDLKNRANAVLRYTLRIQRKKDEEVAKPPFLIAAERHASTNLESQILSDAVINKMFVEGLYNKIEIQNSIDNSQHFAKVEEMAPWKIVVKFDEIDDPVVEAASARMHQQFERREITDSGEMLHVFALRMMMAQHGLLEERLEDVRDQCIDYIDELLHGGQLPARGLEWRWYEGFERAYDGHVYWLTAETEPYFDKVRNHLIKAREKALECRFPAIAEELLVLVESDGQRFFEQVCETRGGENPYALIPVLAAIPPPDFVETWLGSANSNWKWISWALKDRYTVHRSELSRERDWVIQVIRLLEKEANQAHGFRSLRIRRVIPDDLRELADANDGLENKRDGQ